MLKRLLSRIIRFIAPEGYQNDAGFHYGKELGE